MLAVADLLQMYRVADNAVDVHAFRFANSCANLPKYMGNMYMLFSIPELVPPMYLHAIAGT